MYGLRVYIFRPTNKPPRMEPGARDKEKYNSRVESVWKKQLCNEKQYAHMSKQKVFDQRILPAITYASETWTLTAKTENKLASSPNRYGEKHAWYHHER